MAIDRIGALNLQYDAVILNRGELVSPSFQKTIGGQVYYFTNSSIKVKAPIKVKIFNITSNDIKLLEGYAKNRNIISYSFYNESGQGVIIQIQSQRVVDRLSERQLDLYNAIVEIKPIDTEVVGDSV